MTGQTINEPIPYTIADALEMLEHGCVDIASELSNVSAAYADITDEIDADGGEADFTMAEFEAALRAAVADQ